MQPSTRRGEPSGSPAQAGLKARLYVLGGVVFILAASFSAGAAKSEVAFPAAGATPAELQAQATAAQQAAQTALIVGAVGVALGIAGIVVGALGLRARGAAGVPAAGQAKRTA